MHLHNFFTDIYPNYLIPLERRIKHSASINYLDVHQTNSGKINKQINK